MSDLIDTTEMYLKTIFELEEDGVTPLRARIVERLGHSGPTVQLLHWALYQRFWHLLPPMKPMGSCAFRRVLP